MKTDASHPAHSTPAQRRFAFAVLLGGVVCMGMGQTIIFAVLPPLARTMGLADFQVLSIFMLSAVFWVTCGPIWGRLSDSHGRRPFIIAGFAAFALSMLLFASVIALGMAKTLGGLGLYLLLLLTRSIYGIVGSATPGAAQAYIADRTPPEKRTAGMAAFSAAFGLGAMFGPAFAGAFSPIGPLAPLFAVAGLAALAAVAVTLYLPEKTPPKEKRRRPKLSPLDARIRSFLIFGVATGVITSIPVQFIGFYMIDAVVVGRPDSDALAYASIALSVAAAASLFSQLVVVQRFQLPPLMLMRIGPALVLAGHLVIAALPHLGSIVFGMMLSGLGAGLIMPGFVGGASLAVSNEEQGSAAGLSNAAGASGFIFAPLLGFLFYQINPQALFLMTAGIAAAAFVFALFDRNVRPAVAEEAVVER